jgi:hypothetical protein
LRIRHAAEGRIAVNAAKAQSVLDPLQLGQPPGLLPRGDLTFHSRLERPAEAAARMCLGKCHARPFPRIVEQTVKHVNVGLFLSNRIRVFAQWHVV